MSSDLIIFIVSGTIGILIMAIFIILFVVSYQRKKFISELKFEQLKTKAEEEATLASFRGQENERRRIASDLHDDIGASLTAIKMSINYMSEQLKNKQQQDELIDIRDTLSVSIENVRNISHNLMPYALSNLGLSKSVQQLVERISNPPNFEATFQSKGEPIRLKEEVRLMLFRCIQEIINNALKHSQSTKLTVEFEWQEEILIIFVSDNGCGFNYKTTKEDLLKGIGLRNLESRFRIINAKHHVKSDANGTTYKIELPLDNKTIMQ